MTVFTPAQRERLQHAGDRKRHARQKMAAAARRSGSRTNTRIRARFPTPRLRSSRRATMGAWRSSSRAGCCTRSAASTAAVSPASRSSTTRREKSEKC